jgi:hypothetical protein
MVSRQSQAMVNQAHGIQPAKPSRSAPAHRSSSNPKMGNQAAQRLLRDGVIQAKFTVNEPGDRFEQEADRVAEQVMRLPDPTVGTPPRVQRMCSECEEELHRKAGPGVEAVGEGFKHPTSGGRPLPDSERGFFEPRFGQDFSQVRLHTDAKASKAARSINALAYTMRNDIVFAEGRYRPGTDGGRRLLAHELAHTIQQGCASEPIVQRRIGDGHDLTSPRFAGDLVLEAVYDNERLLKSGDKGAAVRKLQQALVDAGFSLPRFGVDGDFGSETKAAVEAFQRASGLTGTNIDGIVGPTTMGWLDQRFSAGPTPAGTSPGATMGCPVIKTVNVDLVSLDGSTRNPVQELERASTIFNQCCVHFNFVGGGSEDAARTRALLGGDTVLDTARPCGSAPPEEVSLFDGATADFGLSSRIRAFYVASINPAVPAYSRPPFCSTGAGSVLQNMAVVTNTASVRGLAHEFGHILLNNGNHPNDPLNLMSAPGNPPGEQLTATDCTTIFANA